MSAIQLCSICALKATTSCISGTEACKRLADDEIVSLAAEEERTILTFDLDFAELAFNRRQPLPSIVIYRLSDQRAYKQIERLTAALMVARPALENGAIVIVDDGKVRIRDLPLR